MTYKIGDLVKVLKTEEVKTIIDMANSMIETGVLPDKR